MLTTLGDESSTCTAESGVISSTSNTEWWRLTAGGVTGLCANVTKTGIGTSICKMSELETTETSNKMDWGRVVALNVDTRAVWSRKEGHTKGSGLLRTGFKADNKFAGELSSATKNSDGFECKASSFKSASNSFVVETGWNIAEHNHI